MRRRQLNHAPLRRNQRRSQSQRRSRSLLWILLGLIGAGLAAALLGRRRDGEEAEPGSAPGGGPETAYPEPAPPESFSGWIAGPAGNLHVRDGGPTESGPLPILFLHSLAGNGGQWSLQLDHLRRHRRAVSLDFRGHGDSDPAENGDYSIAGLAGDVEAAADQLGLRRFVLAGHSLGGSVAIEYAGRHPERVAGLLLADPNGDATQVPKEQVESFVAALREDPHGEIDSYFRQLVLGGDRDAGRWVLEDLKDTHEEAIPKGFADGMSYNPLPALARYPGPKLSVISDMNNLPYSLHRLVPGLPTRLMHGTGHWLMMDRPEVFNHLLEEFLDEVDSGGRR
jgi:pimeloyl-ACP methyl ester carboxylesterase